jgi:hypothetical protein
LKGSAQRRINALAIKPDFDPDFEATKLNMNRADRDRTALGTIIWLALVAMLPGCSEELGPEPMRTTSVHGKITQGGRPIQDGGWIEFIPADGTVGTERSCEIQADGTFSTDRVPVGMVAIRLVGLTIRPPFPMEPRDARRFFGSFPPKIRRTIPDKPSELDIELIDAMVTFRSLQNAAGGRP